LAWNALRQIGTRGEETLIIGRFYKLATYESWRFSSHFWSPFSTPPWTMCSLLTMNPCPKAARRKLNSPSWVVTKSVHPGDEVVVFVRSYGFFATAKIASEPKPRQDWLNRCGAGLTSIRLIKPAISLAAIRREVPDLTWAIYPRSITSPPPEVAAQVRTLIVKRRTTG